MLNHLGTYFNICLGGIVAPAIVLFLLILAVVALAFSGGFWRGLLATVVGAIGEAFFFVEPRNQTDIFVHRLGRAYPVLWNARSVYRDAKAIATVAEVWDVTKEKQAEQELQAARNSLEAIIETAPILIVVINSKGEICMFNRSCELLTGYRRDEVSGQPMLEMLVPDEDHQVLRERFDAAEVSELSKPHENFWVTRNGNHRLVEWRCTRLNPGRD